MDIFGLRKVVLQYMAVHYMYLSSSFRILMIGDIVPQESLDALVRGRDAQRRVRKHLGKTRSSCQH